MNNLQARVEDEQNQVYTLSRKIKELQVTCLGYNVTLTNISTS